MVQNQHRQSQGSKLARLAEQCSAQPVDERCKALLVLIVESVLTKRQAFLRVSLPGEENRPNYVWRLSPEAVHGGVAPTTRYRNKQPKKRSTPLSRRPSRRKDHLRRSARLQEDHAYEGKPSSYNEGALNAVGGPNCHGLEHASRESSIVGGGTPNYPQSPAYVYGHNGMIGYDSPMQEYSSGAAPAVDHSMSSNAIPSPMQVTVIPTTAQAAHFVPMEPVPHVPYDFMMYDDRVCHDTTNSYMDPASPTEDAKPTLDALNHDSFSYVSYGQHHCVRDGMTYSWPVPQ